MHQAGRSIAKYLCVVALVAGCASESDTDQEEDSVEANQQALQEHVPLIPPELAVPEGSQLAFIRFAEGVQIYDCKVATEGSAPAWVFRSPRANLYGIFFLPAGKHYAGPTWEANDGSTVVGARVAGVTVDTSAIPWLLLKASAHTGTGKMSTVSYVQRLFTLGGNAPAGACEAGASVEVDYAALYAFYR